MPLARCPCTASSVRSCVVFRAVVTRPAHWFVTSVRDVKAAECERGDTICVMRVLCRRRGMECVWALPLWDWRDRQGCGRLCSVHAIRTFTVYDQYTFRKKRRDYQHVYRKAFKRKGSCTLRFTYPKSLVYGTSWLRGRSSPVALKSANWSSFKQAKTLPQCLLGRNSAGTPRPRQSQPTLRIR